MKILVLKLKSTGTTSIFLTLHLFFSLKFYDVPTFKIRVLEQRNSAGGELRGKNITGKKRGKNTHWRILDGKTETGSQPSLCSKLQSGFQA